MGTGSTPPPGDPDLYGRLGVPTDASHDEIKRAYRRAARAHHPDGDGDIHSEQFRDATDAYDVLADPDRRQSYDAIRRRRAAEAAAARGRRRIPVREGPRDAQGSGRTAAVLRPDVTLPLTFEQAAFGTTAEISVTVSADCDGCDGRGRGEPTPCGLCSGRGTIGRDSGGITIRHACGSCSGSGGQPGPLCNSCAGAGRRSHLQQVLVPVPPGVEDGTVLRVRPDSQIGELHVTVQVASHPYFNRRGCDLVIDLPLTIAEAALGAVVAVPTLEGAVTTRIPPGTPHGRTLRLRGHGIPHPDATGDLLATVRVVIPTDLTADQRAALKAFAAATPSPRAHPET